MQAENKLQNEPNWYLCAIRPDNRVYQKFPAPHFQDIPGPGIWVDLEFRNVFDEIWSMISNAFGEKFVLTAHVNRGFLCARSGSLSAMPLVINVWIGQIELPKLSETLDYQQQCILRHNLEKLSVRVLRGMLRVLKSDKLVLAELTRLTTKRTFAPYISLPPPANWQPRGLSEVMGITPPFDTTQLFNAAPLPETAPLDSALNCLRSLKHLLWRFFRTIESRKEYWTDVLVACGTLSVNDALLLSSKSVPPVQRDNSKSIPPIPYVPLRRLHSGFVQLPDGFGIRERVVDPAVVTLHQRRAQDVTFFERLGVFECVRWRMPTSLREYILELFHFTQWKKYQFQQFLVSDPCSHLPLVTWNALHLYQALPPDLFSSKYDSPPLARFDLIRRTADDVLIHQQPEGKKPVTRDQLSLDRQSVHVAVEMKWKELEAEAVKNGRPKYKWPDFAHYKRDADQRRQNVTRDNDRAFQLAMAGLFSTFSTDLFRRVPALSFIIASFL